MANKSFLESLRTLGRNGKLIKRDSAESQMRGECEKRANGVAFRPIRINHDGLVLFNVTEIAFLKI
jgi:hypothetical protein